MSASGYTPWSVTAGEIPTTAYWNLLGANDASFNSGTGINDNAIVSRHIANHTITNITYVYNETASNTTGITTTAWTTFANWGSGSFTTSGGDVLLHIHFTYWKGTSGNINSFRIQLNNSANYPSVSGWQQYTNEFASHKMCSRTIWITGLPASTYTVALQGSCNGNSGSLNTDTADWLNIVAVEYLK